MENLAKDFEARIVKGHLTSFVKKAKSPAWLSAITIVSERKNISSQQALETEK